MHFSNDGTSRLVPGLKHFLGLDLKGEEAGFLEMLVTQSCPTLCDPMDYRPPGSSIHGIFQARVLEWGAIAFSETCGHSGGMRGWDELTE